VAAARAGVVGGGSSVDTDDLRALNRANTNCLSVDMSYLGIALDVVGCHINGSLFTARPFTAITKQTFPRSRRGSPRAGGVDAPSQMPRYYCEYCDISLTHSSVPGRKQHHSGRKHIMNVIEYWSQFQSALPSTPRLTPPVPGLWSPAGTSGRWHKCGPY
jgi:hypothetical protein